MATDRRWSWGSVCKVLDDKIGFHDTNRGHAFGGRLEKELPDGSFIWHRIEPDDPKPVDMGMVRFEIVDLPTFEKEIRPLVLGWLPDSFASTAELWEFYRRAYGQAGYHGGAPV